MKNRKRLYCLPLAIITARLCSIITFQFIGESPGSIVIFLMYLLFTTVIFTSGLEILKDRKAKKNWWGLLSGINAIILQFTLIIGFFGELDKPMKNIAGIVSMITILLHVIFCSLLYKFDEKS